MRPIKFRVWNSRKKQWEHEPGEECNLFGEMILLGGFMQVPIEELNDCVACQFTGLDDKNGKDIYEGDIVQLGWDTTDVHWSSLKAEVVWWHNGFYFDVGGGRLAQDTFYQFKYCEVIGNIFENPDLMPNRNPAV